MTEEALVTLAGVAVTAEDDRTLVVLRDVGWEIRTGEWWVVTGGAGSGKSNLLLTAAGLLPPASGRVRLLGLDVATAVDEERASWRREVGFVYEINGRLLGRLSVAENVSLPAAYHENLGVVEARERALGLLALAGLESLADAKAGQLRPSVAQRVALVRVLSLPLRLLFLDAPLRGLPRRDVDWWLGFLASLRARRAAEGRPLAVVASSFTTTAWEGHAERFAEVHEGRFEVVAPPGGGA